MWHTESSYELCKIYNHRKWGKYTGFIDILLSESTMCGGKVHSGTLTGQGASGSGSKIKGTGVGVPNLCICVSSFVNRAECR